MLKFTLRITSVSVLYTVNVIAADDLVEYYSEHQKD